MKAPALTACLLVASTQAAISQEHINAEAVSFMNGYTSKHLKKDDFETSSDYQQRISGFAGKEFVLDVPVAQSPIGPKFYAYDADTQTMTVRLVGNGLVRALNVIEPGSAMAKALGPGHMLDVNFQKFMLKEEGTKDQDYVGQNAMGATAKVHQVFKYEWDIALANTQTNGQFVPPEKTFQIEAARARNLPKSGKWRLYVTSTLLEGQKDFIVDSSYGKSPTIDSPIEITVLGKLMMVVLRRAELIDADTHETLATFTTGADYPSTPVAGAHVLLGVTCVANTAQLAAQAKMEDTTGCVIGAITPGSSAARAALALGDVILAIGDKRVATPADLALAVRALEPGQAVDIQVWRNGALSSLPVQF